jgi:superfamily II RNA helicase
MIQDEIDASLGNLYKQKADCEKEVDEMNQTMIHNRTPFDIVNRYIDLIEIRATSVNKKRKDAEKEIQTIKDTYKFIESDKERILSFHKKRQELETIQNHFELTDRFINTSVQVILDKMQIDEFISRNSDEFFELTLSGAIACQLREVHCLVFSELCKTNTFDKFDTKQLIAIFSCFTNITVSDEQKSFKPNSKDKSINAILLDIAKQYEDYQEFESQNNASTGIDYTIHYDLIDYVIEWTECESATQCKVLLQRLESQKGVFLGEFVKAITKINNISCEMEKVAEMIGNISLLSKLKEIPELTLKFVATNQSLYV